MKKLFVPLLIFFLSVFAYPQISCDSKSEFYADAVGWYLKGYVPALPQVKPYPMNIIRKILETVSEVEEEAEAQKAKKYLEDFSRIFKADAGFNSDIKMKQIERGDSTKNPKYQNYEIYTESLEVSGGKEVNDLFSFAYDLSLKMNNNDVSFQEVLPSYIVTNESSKMSGLSFSSKGMDYRASPETALSFGTDSFYGTAGFYTSAWGFYHDDSNILSPESFPSFNTSLCYRTKYVQLTSISSILAAVNNEDYSSSWLNSFFTFHAVKVPLFNDRLSISYYEAAVSSKKFIPYHFVPLPLPVSGKIANKGENVYAGFGLEIRPLKCIVLTADMYIDDTDFSKLFKLKFNESATRFALKTGFIYTPLNSMCSSISCDYSAVSPYMYTSNDNTEGWNCTEYTSYNLPLGSKLPPNSDMVSLSVNFKPLLGLKLGTKTAFMRHGNSFENLTDEEVLSLFGDGKTNAKSDGTISMSDKKLKSQTSVSDFLMQKSIMYVIQAGVNASYDFKIKNTVGLSFGVDYTFEYIKGDGVNTNIYSGPYQNLEEASEARREWRHLLHDSYNHYFTVLAKVYY